MKQVYKTGYTVKECAQGHIILQMMHSFYHNEIQDAEISNIFWSFINDIYTPCIKLGIPPSFIPVWINDLLGFFSHPNRRGDINFSPNAQNESDKQCNSIKSTKSKSNLNPSSSQLNYLYSIEKLEIAKISDAKKENLQYEYNAHGRSHDRKYFTEHLNISFISKISSHINTKKKECIKLEERTKVLQNTLDKLRSQINRTQALRDCVINEEQSIMEVYD